MRKLIFTLALTAFAAVSTLSLQAAAGTNNADLAFHKFESNCIDLGHYSAKKRELTVRFVRREAGVFYRYSNVPAEIWEKLRILNETGGIGSYMNETVVAHPEKYPFLQLPLENFKVIPGKKKAGDSK